MSTLSVELNGAGVHSIEAPDRFTTNRPFAIELENLGQPVHVHLNFDDDLDRAASIGATNHYVEEDSVRRVHVDTVDGPTPVTGKLKVVTGYGSTTEYVDVTVEPSPEEPAERVVVDESLAEPPSRNPVPESNDPVRDLTDRAADLVDGVVANGTASALALAVLAVVVALAVTFVVADSLLVVLAVGLAVGLAVAAAVWVLPLEEDRSGPGPG